MKYISAALAAAALLPGCHDRQPPEVTASTRWGRAPEWQFIRGTNGGNDAVFDPHTSLYCSFETREGRQNQFCVVMAPDSAMAQAIEFDTVYIQLAQYRLQHTFDSIRKSSDTADHE